MLGSRSPTKPVYPSPPTHRRKRVRRAVLASCLDAIELAPSGHRHRTVYAASARVGNVLAGGELHDEDAATAELTAVAVRVLWNRRADAIRTVRHGITAGMKTPKTAPADGMMLDTRAAAVGAVWQWWETVTAQPWPGRAGVTCLRILAGFALLARRAGKVRLSASYRQVAEAAGVSVGAVVKHRHRWQRFVRVAQRGNQRSGAVTVWQLVYQRRGVAHVNRPEAYEDRISGLFTYATSCGDPKLPSSPGDPAFDGWDRWPSGWRVWCCLDLDERQTPRQVADATGLHRSTVYRTLDLLKLRGLADRTEDGWQAVHAGEATGGLTRARRRRQHADHRAARVRWIAATEERRRQEGAAS